LNKQTSEQTDSKQYIMPSVVEITNR